MNYSLSFIRLSFVFVLISISCVALDKYAFQWAPEPLDPSDNNFSSKRGYKHWQQLSVNVSRRHMSTHDYNISYDYILETIKKYQDLSKENGVLNVSFEEQFDTIYETKMGRVMQVQKDVRNIIVTIRSKDDDNKLPIMVSAHIDGKNTGPAAYDDAAGIASMLEVMNVLCESKRPPKNPVILLFVGVEELGLQGSKLFLKYPKNFSSFLNIESLGPGLPFGIMQKGNGSAAAINALKSSKGILFGTFADDVTRLGIITSSSDAVRFRENGLPGAELLFFGNPTKYHTSLDTIGPMSHLQLLGNSIMNFINEYDPVDVKDEIAAIGISPFALVINLKHTKIVSKTIILIALGSFLFANISWAQSGLSLIIPILTWIIVVIIFTAFGSLHYFINSLFHAENTLVSFIALTFCGVSIFCQFFNIFTSSISPLMAQFALVTFDSIFVIVTSGYDTSIIFLWRLAFSTAASFFVGYENLAVVAYILNLFGFIYIEFVSYLLYNFMTQYTSLIPGFIGDIIPFVLVSIFILLLFFSFLPFMITKRKETKNNFIFLIISLLILTIPLVLPPPYSLKYNVQGGLAHIIDPINGSYVVFSPEVQKKSFRGIKGYIRNTSGIITINQFEMPLMLKDVFFRNASSILPPFVKKWPKYELSVVKNETSDNFQRKIIFNVPDSNPNLTAINLIMNCSNISCLESVEGFDEVQNFEKKDKDGFRYVLRVMPGFFPASLNFTVNGIQLIQLKIAFTWDKWTEEASNFLREFPDFIQPHGKIRSIDDTTLVNYTYI